MGYEELQFEHGSEEINIKGFLFKPPQQTYSLTHKKKMRIDEGEKWQANDASSSSFYGVFPLGLIKGEIDYDF